MFHLLPEYAITLQEGRKILLAFIISAITLTSGCANGTSKTEEAKSEQKTTEENAVVPIKPITEKAIDDNPYMAKSDANVHQDCYNSDTTDEVLPVDIYPEINVSYEKVNQNASPAVFFDTYGHAVVPFQGGLAIRDINADETQTEGYFSPAKHDGGGYVIQSSYSFVDESNRLVCPTSNNHVLMLKATSFNLFSLSYAYNVNVSAFPAIPFIRIATVVFGCTFSTVIVFSQPATFPFPPASVNSSCVSTFLFALSKSTFR